MKLSLLCLFMALSSLPIISYGAYVKESTQDEHSQHLACESCQIIEEACKNFLAKAYAIKTAKDALNPEFVRAAVEVRFFAVLHGIRIVKLAGRQRTEQFFNEIRRNVELFKETLSRPNPEILENLMNTIANNALHHAQEYASQSSNNPSQLFAEIMALVLFSSMHLEGSKILKNLVLELSKIATKNTNDDYSLLEAQIQSFNHQCLALTNERLSATDEYTRLKDRYITSVIQSLFVQPR